MHAMPKRLTKALIIALGLGTAGLSACGLKGPLYIPNDKSNNPSEDTLTQIDL